MTPERICAKFRNALSKVENETERKAIFMALLGQELTAMGVSLPVIVGGFESISPSEGGTNVHGY